ncbi:hypothetical protein CAPTEDRAFT_214089 [Capitella teleta]|uniref:Uncharacterized protein n=1 Tax=Capitella teleta TaxID=283909 RepID=R7TSW1_CAPTE|nr:hypothetical protein CAPTEDRAFT_214089 [Capitella teleta]|eukprot:ELT94115.1 hypothetical protein CAPTEDRAFT_214089 [Capitella teleta]
MSFFLIGVSWSIRRHSLDARSTSLRTRMFMASCRQASPCPTPHDVIDSNSDENDEVNSMSDDMNDAVRNRTSQDNAVRHRTSQSERRVGFAGVEQTEDIHFTLGGEGQEDDDLFMTSPPSQPIPIPLASGASEWSASHRLTDAFFTPPRVYMGGNLRHFSVGSSSGFVSGDWTSEASPAAVPSTGDASLSVQVRSRDRTQSEALFGHRSSITEACSPLVNRRDRSHSAPSILTPAQRQCAEELRRISDEFDRFYHSMDHDRDVAPGNQRPASFPRFRQRSLTAWWQNVVQVLRPSRPSPHSPIEESDPGAEDLQR